MWSLQMYPNCTDPSQRGAALILAPPGNSDHGITKTQKVNLSVTTCSCDHVKRHSLGSARQFPGSVLGIFVKKIFNFQVHMNELH